MARRVLDIKGAVEYFGGLISEWLIREAVKRKKIPHFRVGNGRGRILFDQEALDRWVSEQTILSTVQEKAQPERLLKRAK